MYCPQCGKPMVERSILCQHCGWQERIAQHRIDDDPAMRLLLPVGTSALAIMAGYCGLVSILILPAPFALLLGILALREIKHNQNRNLGGRGRAYFAIVMGGIFTAIGAALIVMLLVSAAS